MKVFLLQRDIALFLFSDIAETQEENKSVTEKVISGGKEISENMNNAEIEYASVKDPLSVHRVRDSKIPRTIIF